MAKLVEGKGSQKGLKKWGISLHQDSDNTHLLYSYVSLIDRLPPPLEARGDLWRQRHRVTYEDSTPLHLMEWWRQTTRYLYMIGKSVISVVEGRQYKKGLITWRWSEIYQEEIGKVSQHKLDEWYLSWSSPQASSVVFWESTLYLVGHTCLFFLSQNGPWGPKAQFLTDMSKTFRCSKDNMNSLWL